MVDEPGDEPGGGFEDDLERFRELGIGEDICLVPTTLEPEIGTTTHVKVAGAGRTVRVVIDDEPPLEIEDRKSFPVKVLEDRTYVVTLQDHHRHTLDRVELDPWVAIPRIKRLSVPAQVTYADPSVRVDLEVEDVQEIEANWRVGENGEDHRANFIDGSFYIPIPSRLADLQFEMRLRSRHAAYSPRAEVTVSKVIHVVHPAATVQWTPSSRTYLRSEPASCDLVCAWVSEVIIEWDGHRQRYSPRDDQRVITTMSLSTAEVGRRQMSILIRDMAGDTSEFHFDYEIKARPFTVSAAQTADGYLAFSIGGGVRAWLTLPARRICLDIPCSAGTIAHDFLVPVEAVLTIMDDTGHYHERKLVLDRLPHCRKPDSNSRSPSRGNTA